MIFMALSLESKGPSFNTLTSQLAWNTPPHFLLSWLRCSLAGMVQSSPHSRHCSPLETRYRMMGRGAIPQNLGRNPTMTTSLADSLFHVSDSFPKIRSSSDSAGPKPRLRGICQFPQRLRWGLCTEVVPSKEAPDTFWDG